MARFLGMLAATALVAGCGGKGIASVAAPEATARRAAPPVPVASAAPEPFDAHAASDELHAAYTRAQAGGSDGAFATALARLVAAGLRPVRGFGDTRGRHAALGAWIAVATPRGTTFFRRPAGAPVAFVGRDPFVGERGSSASAMARALAEALGVSGDVDSPLFALHPDGARLYALGAGCRVEERRLDDGAVIRTLAAHQPRPAGEDVGQPCRTCLEDAAAKGVTRPLAVCATCGCSEGFDDAAVTPDGAWLVASWGRWSLASGAFEPARFRGPFPPAVSEDGRLRGSFAPNPRARPGADEGSRLIVIDDLSRGTSRTIPTPFYPLGGRLRFASTPPRLCFDEVGSVVFSIPDLRRIGHTYGDAEGPDDAAFPDASPFVRCVDEIAVGPLRGAPALADVERTVCSVGGFLLPIAACGSVD